MVPLAFGLYLPRGMWGQLGPSVSTHRSPRYNSSNPEGLVIVFNPLAGYYELYFTLFHLISLDFTHTLA